MRYCHKFLSNKLLVMNTCVRNHTVHWCWNNRFEWVSRMYTMMEEHIPIKSTLKYLTCHQASHHSTKYKSIKMIKTTLHWIDLWETVGYGTELVEKEKEPPASSPSSYTTSFSFRLLPLGAGNRRREETRWWSGRGRARPPPASSEPGREEEAAESQAKSERDMKQNLEIGRGGDVECFLVVSHLGSQFPHWVAFDRSFW